MKRLFFISVILLVTCVACKKENALEVDPNFRGEWYGIDMEETEHSLVLNDDNIAWYRTQRGNSALGAANYNGEATIKDDVLYVGRRARNIDGLDHKGFKKYLPINQYPTRLDSAVTVVGNSYEINDWSVILDGTSMYKKDN